MRTCKYFPGQIFIEINAYKSIQAFCKKKKEFKPPYCGSCKSKGWQTVCQSIRMSSSLTPCKGVL